MVHVYNIAKSCVLHSPHMKVASQDCSVFQPYILGVEVELPLELQPSTMTQSYESFHWEVIPGYIYLHGGFPSTAWSDSFS